MSTTATRITPADDLENDVDEAIRQAGDQREAIRGLILGQRELMHCIDRCVSAGYVRGRRA